MPEICKCPTPGTDKVGKCPIIALGWGGGGGRGGGGGGGGGGGTRGGWEELTDALDWKNCGVFKRWSLLTGVR